LTFCNRYHRVGDKSHFHHTEAGGVEGIGVASSSTLPGGQVTFDIAISAPDLTKPRPFAQNINTP